MSVVTLPAGFTDQAMAVLRANPGVLRVEQDRSRKVEATATDPNDPRYPDQWSLPKIGWDHVHGTVTPSGKAVVALLDTGVDATHPDLAGKLVPGASFVEGADPNVDTYGHGTWLAGIVAAATDNAEGIAGIGYDGVQIMPVTVLGSDGFGYDSDIIRGVVYAADAGANVILMAFSNPGYSAGLQAAIDYAWSKGVVLVAATGNDGSSAPTYPAGDRGVMGVSNTTPADVLAADSNYGADTFLGAPGTGIVTTAPGNTYTSVTGTSASSAEVAASAALLRAVDPPASNGTIVGRLARSAAHVGTQEQTGNGRLDLARAVADDGTDEVEPAGVGGQGGPFVGPYMAAPVSTSTNITTDAVTDLTPDYAAPGALKVPMFTFRLTPTANDTFQSAKVDFNVNTSDIQAVYLYQESGSVPGTFDASTDTQLASATSNSGGTFTLNPTDFAMSAGAQVQFYVVLDLKSGITIGDAADGHIRTNYITFSSGAWPSSTEYNNDAGIWNPAGQTLIGATVYEGASSDHPTVMEAELADINTTVSGKTWTSYTATAGYSGTSAMQPTPNTGTTVDTGSYAAGSPHLDFKVNFSTTGTHYVWIYGLALSSADDSVHIGLDGAEVSTADKISTSGSSYTWSNATLDGPVASFSVGSTGLHTVGLYMREDGTVVDKILITTNSSYTPSGSGPNETRYHPPTSLSATPGSTQVTLAWTDNEPQETGEIIQYSTDNATWTTFTTAAAGTASEVVSGLSPATLYYFRVRATGANGDSDNTTVSSTTNASLGILAANQDVGSPATAGSSSYAAGTYTVKGAGTDIAGHGDQFQFAYLQLTGDGALTARVASITNTNSTALAGVMFRDTLADDSAHAMMALTPTSGVKMVYRASASGNTSTSTTAGISAPEWVRMIRVGNTFKAQYSSNGTSWTQQGTTQTITMGSTIYVGLAVDSRVSGSLNTATFDNVSLSTPPTAVADSYSVNEDTTLTVAASGVLANDTDPESDSLTTGATRPISGPSNGTLTLNSDGSFTYTPSANFNGTDSFTYKANDGIFDSSAATVTITVNAVNDAPVNSLPSAATVGKNQTLVFQSSSWNLISISDVDAGTSTVQEQLTATNGTMTLSTTTGLTFSVGDGTADATMTFTGTITAINAALAGMSFTPTTDYLGAASIELVTNDQGNTGSGGALSDTDSLSITAVSLGIFTADVGIGSNGTASYSGGTYTMTDNGTDITWTDDSFHFVYMAVTGDARITARVASEQNTSDYAKAAVMFRESLATNSRDAFLPLSPGHGTNFEYRTSTGGTTSESAWSADGITTPYWIRVTRVGNTFKAERSTNGSAWSQVGTTQTITMASTAYVGLALSARDSTQTVNTSTFDNVSVDRAPAAVADSYSVNEDNTLTVAAAGVLANDSDADGDTITATLVSNVANGSLTLNSNGSFTYTPSADYNGSDSFTYKANDGALDSNTVTVSITVNAVNDVPSFTKGANQTVNEDAGAQTVTGWATAISKGPSNESSQTVNFIVSNDNNALFSTQPAISAAGALTYTPAANANGSTTVSVQIHDNGGTSNGGVDTSATQTFTITVNAVNDVPSFTKGANQSVDEDAAAQSVAGWATSISAGPANESGQTVNFIVTNNNNALFSVQPAVSATGTLTYTLAANANGSATVSVSIHDDGGTANGGVDTSAVQTFTITVAAVNDPPVNTVPSTQQTGMNNTLVFSTTYLNAMSIADVDAGSAAVQVQLTGTNGTITLGSRTGLSFSVGDGTADPTMTFTGTISSVNSALSGLSFIPTTNFTGAASLQIVTNDQGNTGSGGAQSDTDTVTINVVSLGIFTSNQDVGSVGLQGSSSESAGTYTVTGSGADIGGTADQFQFLYRTLVGDGALTVRVTSLTNTNAAAKAGVMMRDTLAANAAETMIDLTASNGVEQLWRSTTGGSTSSTTTAAIDAPYWLRMVRVGDTFKALTSPDGVAWTQQGSTQTITMTSPIYVGIAVTAENGVVLNTSMFDNASFTTAPTAVASSYSVNEDGTLVVGAPGVMSNDSDPEGDSLTAVLVSDVSHGTLTFNSDGSFTYAPAANFNGSDSFTYKDNDGVLDSNTVMVTLTVNSVNDVPSFTKGANQTIDEDAGAQTAAGWATSLSAGPADESAQTLSFIVSNDNNALFSSQPAIASNGTLTYTPAADANGSATVSVQIHDNGGTANGGVDTSATQTFTITVDAVNDGPVNGVPAAQTTPVNTTRVFSSANSNLISISDVDAATSEVQVTLTATHGTVTLSGTTGLSFSVGDGTADATMTFTGTLSAINTALAGLSFIPETNFSGAGSLEIVTDDQGNSGSGGALTDTDTIDLTITSSAPTATADTYSMTQDNTLVVAAEGVLANDTDPGNLPLTVAAPRPVTAPSHGDLTLNADGSFTYTPTAGFSGIDTFTYKATNDTYDSNAATVTITIDDGAFVSGANWSSSFGARYLKVTIPAYVPTGAVITGATFYHTYRSATDGDTTCYYFEVYNGATLLATHGSSGSPVSCNATTSYTSDSVALPEIDTVAKANAVTIKLFVKNSGSHKSRHRLMNVGIKYYLD